MNPVSVRRARAALILVVLGLVLGAALVPWTPASAATSLKLSRSVAGPGDTVTLTGYGFTAQDDIVVSAAVLVYGKAQRLQATSHTDDSGSFTTQISLPGGTSQGKFNVAAKDFHNHSARTQLTVLPLAYLQAGGGPQTAYLIPLHAFYVSGTGFSAGETVTLNAQFPRYDGTTVVIKRSVTADSHGSFYEIQFTTPRNAQAGSVTLTGSGSTSKKSGTATLKVVYRPFVLLGVHTVRPGTPIDVRGYGFTPNTTVRVSLTIPRNGATTETLSRTVGTDDNGSFRTFVGLPADVRLGTYRVSAVGIAHGFKAVTSVAVSVHPTIALTPSSILPGQAFNATGSNFGSGVQITVTAVFSTPGGKQTVRRTVTTGNKGQYSASIPVPGNALPGKVTVTAASPNAHTNAEVTVGARPKANPTNTPMPNPTATSAPAPTSTPLPNSPPPQYGRKHVRFRYVSIWYHTVAVGTYDHVVVQANLHVTLGIWVHVYFPSGGHWDYYQNTDPNGRWEKQFTVPKDSISSRSNQALITFRLWHGKDNVKEFSNFTLVP